MRGVHIGAGVAAASVAAGPIFVLAGFGADAMTRPAAASAPGDIGGLVAVALVFAIFGTLLALVPNLTGAALLGALGRGNPGVRLPPFWALIGAVAGAVIGYLTTGETGGGVMAAVGAACALICRWGTRWDN